MCHANKSYLCAIKCPKTFDAILPLTLTCHVLLKTHQKKRLRRTNVGHFGVKPQIPRAIPWPSLTREFHQTSQSEAGIRSRWWHQIVKLFYPTAWSKITPRPPVGLMGSRKTSALGFAESYGDRKSRRTLAAVHQDSAAPSQGLEGHDSQPRGLCCRKDPFCRSCRQGDGAKTHWRPHQTGVPGCCGTTGLPKRTQKQFCASPGSAGIGCRAPTTRMRTTKHDRKWTAGNTEGVLPGMKSRSPGSSTHSYRTAFTNSGYKFTSGESISKTSDLSPKK